MILYWAAFRAILDWMWPVELRLDTPAKTKDPVLVVTVSLSLSLSVPPTKPFPHPSLRHIILAFFLISSKDPSFASVTCFLSPCSPAALLLLPLWLSKYISYAKGLVSEFSLSWTRGLRSNSAVNRATSKWNQSCHPKEVTSLHHSSNIWNVKIGQNNLRTGPMATLNSKQLFANIIGKQTLWQMDWKFKTFFRISTLC